MLDFSDVNGKRGTLYELTQGMDANVLRGLTNEMIDTMLAIIAECRDEDIAFVPVDPRAHDAVAATAGEVDMPWTLGHIVVHVTASSEESAALAAELARGVPHRSGRSRAEVAWETVTTIAQCRHRLEESRRMRLASLDMWPDNPDLENVAEVSGFYLEIAGRMNATARFVMGLLHDSDHLEQLREVVRQARAARVSA